MKNPIGHSKVQAYLQNACQQDRLGNLLLFSGNEGIGKKLVAQNLAKALLCENPDDSHKFDKGFHPDYHLYEPEGKLGLHSIDSMRQMCKEVYLYPHEAKRKVFILDEADRMLPVSANALLKTFEEPSENSTIIMISAHPERLLPTIVSRSQRILFQPLSNEDLKTILSQEAPQDDLQAICDAARGSVSEALKIIHKKEQGGADPLIDILMGKYKGHYLHLQEVMTTLLDSKEESIEPMDDYELTAHQRQHIKKLQEGAQSMQGLYALDRLLKDLTLWYRDLELVKVAGSAEKHLYHSSCKDALEHIARQNPPKLERVMEYIRQTKEGAQRAIKHEVCLEALFFKLGLI